MIPTLINPEEFKVVRVISFCDEYTKRTGTICYMRPYTQDYKKEILDDFDHSMITWLKSLNLKNVKFVHSENVLFDHQLPQLSRIYDGGRPNNKLFLVCYEDYSQDEMIVMGVKQINAICIELKVFWNTDMNAAIPLLCGAMTFDKNKKDYYFDVVKTITSL